MSLNPLDGTSKTFCPYCQKSGIRSGEDQEAKAKLPSVAPNEECVHVPRDMRHDQGIL